MSFTPKKIYINGNIVPFVQNSLKIKLGAGETINRVQISGRTTILIPAENQETKIAEISFELITQDLDSNADPRVLIQTWKANSGANNIVIEPDGAGKNQLMKNASLINDPEIMETPDGTISLTFQGSPITLVN